MRPEIAYADCRLDAWASWVRSTHGAWPSRTLLGRIMDEGVSGAAQGAPVESMPYQVLQTDRAVAQIEPQLRRTVKVYYLTHASSEVKAASLHISRATFWRLVGRAQQAVFNQLNGETENGYSSVSLRKVSL